MPLDQVGKEDTLSRSFKLALVVLVIKYCLDGIIMTVGVMKALQVQEAVGASNQLSCPKEPYSATATVITLKPLLLTE